MAQLPYIRKEFVKQVLEKEGKLLHENQSRAIAKLLNFHSNRLYEGRDMDVKAEDALDGKMTLTIPAYGRFLDIKPKNRKTGKNTENKYESWRRNRRAKSFPIYNRFVFGHYYALAYKLMYGLTDEVAEGIKKQFEKGG